MFKPQAFDESTSRPMNRRPYRGQFLLIVLITAITLLVGWLGLTFLEQRFIAATGESVSVVAADIADSLDLLLFERYGDIQVLADMVTPKIEGGSGQAALFATVKHAYPLYRWIGVANAEGRIVDSSDPSSLTLDVRTEDWFQEIHKTGVIHLGDVRPSLVTGGADAVAFSKPLYARSVHGRSGVFLGVVTTRVGVPALEEVVTRAIRTFQEGRRVWRTLEYQVVRNDGQVFIDSDFLHKGNVNLKQMGLPSVALSTEGQSGYIEEDHRRRHVPVLTGYARTKGRGEYAGFGWTVLIRIDRSEVLDPIRALLWKIGLTGGFVVVPLVSMLLWTARRVQQEWAHAQHESERALANEQHLQAIIATIPECVMLVSREGVVRAVNQAACILFDVQDETELIGKPILPFISLEDRDRFHAMHRQVCAGEPGALQCQVSRPLTMVRWVEVTASCLRDKRGAVEEMLYVLRDITDRTRTERRILGQHEITRVLAEAMSIPEAGQEVLRTICVSLEWSIGILWLLDVEIGELRAMEDWSSSPHGSGRFLQMSRALTFLPGRGLPGRVWASGEPAWIPDVVVDDNFPRAQAASQDGLHSAIGFPIQAAGEVVGVMEFFSSTVLELDPDMLAMMKAMGSQIGGFMHRKRIEEREAEFGRILDETLNEIYLVEAETLRLLHVNRGAQTNLGYSVDELLRLTLLDLMPEFTGESFAAQIQPLQRGGRQSLQFEAMHRRKDGSTYPIQAHVQRSSFGGRSAFVAIVLDTTEQRRAQRRTTIQHAVTRALVDSSTIEQAMTGVLQAICSSLGWDLCLLWQVDSRHRVLRFGHIWKKAQYLYPNMTLVSQRETFASGTGLPGRVWERGEGIWIPDILMDTAFLRHAAAAQDGLHGACAFPVWLRGDVYGVMECFSRAPQLPEPDLLGTLGTIGSQVGLFVERMEAEAALRENEERIRLIIATALDAVITMGADGTITEWNAQAESMFGWSYREAVGQDMGTMIIPPQHREAYTRGLARYLRTGEGPFLHSRIEIAALRRDGQELPVEVTITPLQLNGAVVFSAFLRDITDRKESELAITAYAKQLEQINQHLDIALTQAQAATEAKSAFLATMSHEIRTPMNGVIGMTGLLLETELTPEQREYADTVRASGEHLLTIINDILDFSKVEAGKLTLEIIDFDLRNAMEECLDLTSGRASAKGLNLACLFRAEVPTALRGDPGRLRQIVTNLLGNAIKFTRQGDVVLHVGLVEERSQQVVIRFEITDTGIGIAPEACARLFESFSQADASMARKYGGTGLGLAISKRLVEMMGGTIGVESTPGQGSHFWFTIPLEQQPLEQRALPLEHADLRGLHALVVDDKEINRQVFELYLKKWGLHGTLAECGDSALRLLRESAACGSPYDVAILDADMADMDGLHLADAIHRDPALKKTRIVMLSSAGRRGDAKAAVAAGVVGYLTKPVRESHVRDCLIAVMGMPRGEQQGTPVELSGVPACKGLVTRHSLAEAELNAGIRLLLAEDNTVNQKVAVHMLEKMGYRVDVVANGTEAVEATARIAYSAVLMDCQMPEMDGFDATRAIRKREAEDMRRETNDGRRPPRLSIIAMTANSMTGDRERCLEAGMDEYVSKPITAQDLAHALTTLLQNQEAASHRRVHSSPACGNG